jgi:hypothetical protein
MKDEDRLRIEGYDHEILKCEEEVRRYRESESAYLAVHPGIGKGIRRANLTANILLAAALAADFFLLAVLPPAGVFFLAAVVLIRVLFAKKYKDSYMEKHLSPDLTDRKQKAEEQGRLAAQLRLEKEKFLRSIQ